MRAMREHLAQAGKIYYKYQKEAWFLDAVEIYCDTINCFADDLGAGEGRFAALVRTGYDKYALFAF